MKTNNSGRLIARHYLNNRPFRLEWREGRIVAFKCVRQSAAEDLFVAPALFDPQINGYAGVDFQQDDLSEAQLVHAARKLRADGCARFLLTLITDEWGSLTARLEHLHGLREGCAELRAAIAGWHLEGPFMSSEPGYCGAHEPEAMIDPTPEKIRQLRKITGQDPMLVTLAPERRGALAAIRLAVSLGIKISLGHTNADAETLAAAVEAGATGFTHLGNGCPRELSRRDNIVWRALETPGLQVSLIPDALHVSPALFRILHRLLDGRRVFYTTDAMAAAASPPGEFRLGRLKLAVGADQVVRLPGTSYFAGSALRPWQGVERASWMLDCPWQECWQRMSLAPARFLGLPGDLEAGGEATFCVIKAHEDGLIRPLFTCLRGERTGPPVFPGIVRATAPASPTRG